MMDAQEILQRLLSLDGVAEDPRRSPREMHEAKSRMHEIVREMRQEEVEKLLSIIIERSDLDPRIGNLAEGFTDTLLERLVDMDLGVATSWAKTTGFMSVIAAILSRRDPMKAVSFVREHGLKIDETSLFAQNIGQYAVEVGPDELIALEDVLGERGINQALEFIPHRQCESFADAWYRRIEEGLSVHYDLGRVLQRWGGLAPLKMVSWYQARPHLGGDVQFVYGLLSTLLHAREQVGLDFAEAEFTRVPKMRRMLFTIAVNSIFVPDLWYKLAERLPADAKPTIDAFSDHLRPGRAPGPEGIVIASMCIDDAEQRYNYLKTTLKNSGWANDGHNRSQHTIRDARTKLENLSLEPSQLSEMLELYDRVAAAALSRESGIPQ